MKINRNNPSGIGALKSRLGFAFATLAAVALMAAPTIANQGTAHVGSVSVPEVFDQSLFVPQAEAEAEQGTSQAPIAEYEVEQTVSPGGALPAESEDQLGSWDPALDLGSGDELATTPEQFLTPSPTFEGMDQTETGFNPPDTQGDVGPNHYIQVVNSHFEIWDKEGTSLTGPTAINLLWSGVSDAQAACRDSNSGDPIVMYDHLADVWLITKFTRPHFAPSGDINTDPDWQCIAVSRGPDPVNDGWYLYQFAMVDEFGTNFSHDYPKFGVWPDGYYMGSQEGFDCCDLNIVIFDRANMINGNPAGSQSLHGGGNPSIFWLPADLDGPPPPPGTPGYIARQVDSAYYGVGGSDRIEIRSVTVDWVDPTNTTLGPIQTINVLPFEETLCGGGNPGLFQYCIPQPGVASQLEALTVWPMFRLQYRNLGDRDAMVFNHTVNSDGNGTAGVRWYELERSTPGTGPWTLRQQGTYAPQNAGNSNPEHRFMGSIAMDRFGNLALGYSVSSENLVADGDAVDGYPSIRYTGREDNAPLGLMPEVEVTMAQGTTVRDEDGGDADVRWGDYSAMVVDPVDDCTFWYTQEYLTLPANNWSTRIAAFSFADCSADLSVTKSADSDPATAGNQITYTITVYNAGVLNATNVIVTDTLPDGFTYLADSVPGDQCQVAGQTVTCAIGDIAAYHSSSFTITAVIDSAILLATDGPDTFDNVADVDGDQEDPDVSNDSFTLSTLVNELADLSVTKTCKPDRDAVVGEDAPFCEIVISNSGPSMARAVTMNDAITANGVYTIDDIVTTQGSCIPVDGDVECNLIDIDAGDSVTVSVYILTEEAIDVNNIATAATDTPESDYSNNDATGQISFVIPTSDLAVTKDCKPDGDLLVGEDGTCTIIVQNFGPSDAEAVHVVDTHISNKSFTIDALTPAPQCGWVGNVVTCDFASIAAGASETIVVTINEPEPMDINDTVTVTSANTDPDNSNNEASDGLHIVEVSDLSVTKDCKPDGDLLAGDIGTCTIIVKNFGPSTADNVHVVDTHISNKPFTIDALTPSPECNILDNIVRCDFVSIAKGATETIVVSISEPEPMDINDTVIVESDSTDPDNSNNTASDGLHIVGVADLSIFKFDLPDPGFPNPVVAGTHIGYILHVRNAGPSTAMNVVVEDLLPAGTSLAMVPPTCTAGVPGDPSKPTVCVVGNIEPGGERDFPIVLHVLPDTTGWLHNTATVSSDTLDPDNSFNQWSQDTPVVVLTDLSDLTKMDNPDPVAAGSVLNYVITMSNQGPSTATNVALYDALPGGTSLLTYKVLAGNAFSCVDSGLNLACSIGTMNPGDSFTMTISVLVDPSMPDGPITNCVSVTQDSGPEIGPVCEDTEVVTEADLWIDKTGSFITQNPSSNIIYTLTVHNDSGCSVNDPQVCGEGGPSDAHNVVVTDTLPVTSKKLRVVYTSESCTYDDASHTVTCNTPVLAVGDTVVHQIEVDPVGRLRAITNLAEVSSDTGDPDPGNNADTMTLSVGGGGQKSTGE